MHGNSPLATHWPAQLYPDHPLQVLRPTVRPFTAHAEVQYGGVEPNVSACACIQLCTVAAVIIIIM